MKKSILLLLLVTTFTACHLPFNGVSGNGNIKTEERNVANFNQLSTSGSFDVKIVEGTPGKVTVEADENLLEYIVTEVNNGKLAIYTKSGFSFNTRHNIIVTVPCQNLDEVILTGSGSIVSDHVLKSDSFNTKVTGSGDVELAVEANETNGQVSGSGDLKISGKTTEFQCQVTGSGDVDAYDFSAKNVSARVSGSGGLKVFCYGNLQARVTGSGDIYYKGNPETRDLSTSGSGDITAR